MTTKKSVDTVVSEAKGQERGICPPSTTKPCIAQANSAYIEGYVQPLGDCCEGLVQEFSEPISLVMKEIKATILKGTVICESTGAPVVGAIVVATSTGRNYVGITDGLGRYIICVPAVDAATKYYIEAYLCGSCVGNIFTDAPCNSGNASNQNPV